MQKTVAILLFAACGKVLSGQNALPIVGYGYMLPTPIPVAPGQLLTVLLEDPDRPGGPFGIATAGADLPLSLAGISATYGQVLAVSSQPYPGTIGVPILQVYPCFTGLSGGGCAGLGIDLGSSGTKLVAVTLQIPFEAVGCSVVGCRAPGQPGPFVAHLWVVLGPTAGTDPGGAWIKVAPASDQVHILTDCDSFLLYGTGAASPTFPPYVPCPSIVTHSDGSRVSAANPAKPGEEVVAYALGLGQTTPPLTTGKLVSAAAPTQTTFGLDFNFHPNALASRPLPSAPAPVFAGATPGFVGLYQVNFVVPPVPAGTPPCVDMGENTPAGANFVESNLTVSVGGTFSFDGARICVAVPGP